MTYFIVNIVSVVEIRLQRQPRSANITFETSVMEKRGIFQWPDFVGRINGLVAAVT